MTIRSRFQAGNLESLSSSAFLRAASCASGVCNKTTFHYSLYKLGSNKPLLENSASRKFFMQCWEYLQWSLKSIALTCSMIGEHRFVWQLTSIMMGLKLNKVNISTLWIWVALKNQGMVNHLSYFQYYTCTIKDYKDLQIHWYQNVPHVSMHNPLNDTLKRQWSPKSPKNTSDIMLSILKKGLDISLLSVPSPTERLLMRGLHPQGRANFQL